MRGFTLDNYHLLLEQISTQALNAEAILGRADQHGQRYTVDLETKSWLSVSEQIAAVINHLSEERKQEVLDFARSLRAR